MHGAKNNGRLKFPARVLFLSTSLKGVVKKDTIRNQTEMSPVWKSSSNF